jgi:hypothetical protein
MLDSVAAMRPRLLLGSPTIEDPRPLSGEARLAGTVLHNTLVCLGRVPSCLRHELARSWIEGFYPCGCPYESTGLEFPLVAALLRAHPEALRALILRNVTPALPRPFCRRT